MKRFDGDPSFWQLLVDDNEQLRAENKRLEEARERLELDVLRDDLTGLMNARALRVLLAQRVREVATGQAQGSVLFLDVDFFKAVNEIHGHRVAGGILARIGRIIAARLGERDIGFRYGGDEFVVVAGTSGPRARELGERLRAAVEAHSFEVDGLSGPAVVRVTVSVGVCDITPSSEASQILDTADRAMFEAKRRSRNTLVAA